MRSTHGRYAQSPPIFHLRHFVVCANLPFAQATEALMANHPFPLGSVSSGTLKQSDLIAAFAAALDDLQPGSALAAEAQEYDPETAEPDKGNWLLEELFEALDEIAPPYCYFGTVDGDGANFGFWIDFDTINEDIASGDLLKVADLAEIPPAYSGEALRVSDHGNAWLYTISASGVPIEIWSVV